jgi:two-component system, NtrC family, sensor kinase
MEARLESIMRRVSCSPLIDAGEQDAATRLVLDSVCEGLASARAGVWFFDTAAAGIRCRLLIDKTHGTESESILLTSHDYPNYFKCLYAERAIVAHDACNDPATAEFREGYLEPLGITSMLDVPIRHHGDMIGIICIEHTGPMRQWRDDEITFACGLGDLVGRAINAHASRIAQADLATLNAQLEAKVAERTASLEATLQRLRQTQDDLIQSEKLASLGSMVAGIAHELNTPIGNALTVITTLGERARELQEQAQSGAIRKSELYGGLSVMVEMADLVDRSIHRASNLITSFKQVAVDQISERRRGFDLREVIDENLAALRPSLRHQTITLINTVAADIACDSFPGPLGQVLTNIVQNAAIHGIGERCGTIEIRASVQEGRVELVVADNGAGMDASTAARVFEPFFTTRLGRGGSGLGLAICHRIATTILSGELRVVSTPGMGSQFILSMPLTSQSTMGI